MSLYTPFSCYIIGEETMPIQCAELLIQKGHTIYGLISPDQVVIQWAEDHGLPVINPTDDMMTFVSQHPFDYLFSIINGTIIPPAMLALPQRYAINYHDSPLPRYAGNYATSWAIMNRETEHAISWHIMVKKVDAGDILKQLPVNIQPDETALTLNAKCYDVALNAFAELIDDLAQERVIPQPQNLADRTFFSLYKRPSAGCLISWSQPAEEIDALCRALDFGPYRNELGLPKLLLGDEVVIVTQTALTTETAPAPPGTVVKVTDQAITISTTTTHIALKKLLTLDGQPLSLAKAIIQYQLVVGQRLPDLEPPLADRVTEVNGQICRQESFWVKRLTNRHPLTLPYSRPTVSLITAEPPQPAPVTLPVPIPPPVVAFVQEQHPTWQLDHFLLAAFIAYLARLSRDHHFDVGFGNRETQQRWAALPNLWADYVPFHAHIDLTWYFNEIYEAVHQQIDDLTSRLTYNRDLFTRYPQLEHLHYPTRRALWPVVIQLGNLLETSQSTPQPPFKMVVTTEGDTIDCRWIYDPMMFDATSLTDMLSQFTTLLHGLVTAIDNTPFWNLPLLTDAEKHQLLVTWNNTHTTYPAANRCIHHLFEAQVDRTPEAIALVFNEERLTYRQLNERANQLAHHLQQLGVGPDQGVGLCVTRSPEMIIGVLGILKAGGAYVPLNPDLPADRLAFMVADIGATVIVTQAALGPLFPQTAATIVCLDSDFLTHQTSTNPTPSLSPANLVYIVYTSGSTGQAKGVMLSHHNLVNAYLAWEAAYELRPQPTNHLQMANFSFDVFAGDWTRALCSGGKLVICPHDTLLDPPKLYRLMGQEQINCAEFVPAVFRYLLQYLTETGQNLAFMRLLIVASDNWYVGECQTIQQVCGPETRLINSYGLTEATIDSTYFDCAELYQTEMLLRSTTIDRLVPIGRPFANTQIYILDPYLQPVPVGITGEIYIGGAGVAQGYLNRPDLTAQRFIPDIFNPDALNGHVSARLYKTGDLGRYLPDGNIEFLGRADHQIKLRGFRIELGEIETVLSDHPALQANVVVAHESNIGDKFLVAYYVPRDESAPSSRDLRHYLAETLPAYMVPSAFMALKKLPLTPNGKIDRRALPTPDITPMTNENYVPPRNPVEEILAEMWANILRLDQVGVEDNFFDLGGHSLLATKLISWIQKTFQIQLPLRSLFEKPTIVGLAETLIEHEVQPGQVMTTARLRQKIKQMSPTEIQARLQRKNAT